MRKILIVDNNQRDSEKLYRLLTDIGYDVTTTNLGESAVHILRDSIPDGHYTTIISDLSISSCGPVLSVVRPIPSADIDRIALMCSGPVSYMAEARGIYQNVYTTYRDILLIAATKVPDRKGKDALRKGFSSVIQKPITGVQTIVDVIDKYECQMKEKYRATANS